MYTAMLVLCLSVAQGQTPDEVPADVQFFNQRIFRFPLNVSGRQADIKQMVLYVSSDQGVSWDDKVRVAGDKNEIVYTAPCDGQYWFQVAAINFEGKQEPRDVSRTDPRLIQKMLIDTLKPLLRITDAKRDHDGLTVSWEVKEQNPDWTTFKLEYQTEPSGPWTPASVQPSFIGKTHLRTDGTSAVALRLQLRDRAGNHAHTNFEVPGTGNVAGQPGPIVPSLVVPTGLRQDGPPMPPFPAPNDPLPTPPTTFTPPPNIEPPPELNKPNPVPNYPRPPAWNPGPGQAGSEGGRIVGSSETPPRSTPPAAVSSTRALPPLQYVNTREVTLTYQLSKVGPSGVGKVDLWRTRNDGQTWERYAKDAEPSGAGKHERSIELNEGDGIYGFILVVKSRAGLGRRDPKTGDVPEIRIELDTAAPVARLFAPVPDSQHANALILSWEAKDKNLIERPISLEWAERKEGPWQPIATHLENTGSYSWQLPAQLPVQVYLKVSVRDAADNVGFAISDEPQLVDLSEPEGKLINVTPRR